MRAVCVVVVVVLLPLTCAVSSPGYTTTTWNFWLDVRPAEEGNAKPGVRIKHTSDIRYM